MIMMFAARLLRLLTLAAPLVLVLFFSRLGIDIEKTFIPHQVARP
jgi:hypothetical protein